MQLYIDAINSVMETDFTEDDIAKSLSEIEEWDSLSGLGLMSCADEQFNVVLTPSVLENAKTLNDLIVALQGSDS